MSIKALNPLPVIYGDWTVRLGSDEGDGPTAEDALQALLVKLRCPTQ
jgi:hypothetical protein